MSIFRCKMCGGTIEFNPGDTIGVCDSCGTKQTLPRIDNDRRANLYDRANHFRRNNEYDKAADIYEQVLNEDTADAEAYWSLVLCRYGIEYVEDPATHKRVPTVNCAQFTSIFDDDNYKSALHYADDDQRAIYEAEADAINEIQKGILAISQKEDPFDVFICYKETDRDGRRTQDSVLANDLYHQLTNEGFKVFFSRITLEDKLGRAYEPYIFAALNSAKVMVVLGTKPEYFNAVWVKNEWRRYLSLVKQSGGQKVLIPAYRDMDPYNLPEEFSHLQAQDMSKLGFMPDLIRGIKKIAKIEEQKQDAKETVVVGGNASIAPLLKRAFMFLEDGNWTEADTYCEKVLDQDPENAQAYLGKLMAELHVHRQEDLKNCKEPFNNNNNYQKAVRFGDDLIADMLMGFIDYINEHNAEERRNALENAKKKSAKRRNALEKTKKKFKKILIIVLPILVVGITLFILSKTIIVPKQKKNEAMLLMDSGDYDTAYSLLEEMNDHDEVVLNKYDRAVSMIDSGDYEAAYTLLGEMGNDDEIVSSKYDRAVALINAGNYEAAYVFLDGLDYKDSTDLLFGIKAECEREFLSKAQVGSYVRFGSYVQDNILGNEKEDIEWLVLEKDNERLLLISKFALDYQPYNTSIDSVTWENSSLRKWLNEVFLTEAFSSEEQNRIIYSVVTVDNDPESNIPSGNTTMDKVFLLNIEEVKEYFNKVDNRKCQGTAYCYALGAYKASNGNCCWWLRSPSIGARTAVRVTDNGSIDKGKRIYKYVENGAVRPAIWIDISH